MMMTMMMLMMMMKETDIGTDAWCNRQPVNAVNYASRDRQSTADDETDITTYAWHDRQPTPDDETDITTYAWHDDGSIEKNHSFLLPRDVRAIIVGKSGSGKTTLLTYLLLEPDVMDYEKLMVCGKSLHQPGYRVMQ